MHCLDKTYRVCEITNTKHYCGLYDDRFTIIETVNRLGRFYTGQKTCATTVTTKRLSRRQMDDVDVIDGNS